MGLLAPWAPAVVVGAAVSYWNLPPEISGVWALASPLATGIATGYGVKWGTMGGAIGGLVVGGIGGAVVTGGGFVALQVGVDLIKGQWKNRSRGWKNLASTFSEAGKLGASAGAVLCLIGGSLVGGLWGGMQAYSTANEGVNNWIKGNLHQKRLPVVQKAEPMRDQITLKSGAVYNINFGPK